MALCGIPRIDDLNQGTAGATTIGPGDPDTETVGVIQGMLIGQGQRGLPNLLSPDCGKFGPVTSAAVQNFRVQQGLAAGNQVDAQTLQALVQAPAPSPILSRGYMTLVLDLFLWWDGEDPERNGADGGSGEVRRDELEQR
jgi:hypothetical protein